ncbi:MAG: hypothetical protein GF364_08135 [Candidatus Lokiarchaeota archaeon]|nr:hypothetical protein [Candidatus Lokiarchaeota archaeon]
MERDYMLKKVDDREYVLRVIQDLRVKVRDETDFAKQRKLKKIIKKFEEGLKEEFPNS